MELIQILIQTYSYVYLQFWEDVLDLSTFNICILSERNLDFLEIRNIL